MDKTPREDNLDKEIDLMELFYFIWDKKIQVLLVSMFFGIVAAFYSLSLNNVYKSEAVLAPVYSSQQPGSDAFSGLGSFVGLNMPNQKADKIVMSIEIMKSLNFFKKISQKYDVLIPLLASESWDRKKNKLTFNNEIIEEINELLKGNSSSSDLKFSMQKAHESFLENLSILQGKDGLIKVSIIHISPFVAEKWVNILINEINEISREEDMSIAQESINYLEMELANTKLIDLKESITSLTTEQHEIIMIAKSRPDYLLKVLSPPYASENKIGPYRTTYCIYGFLLGLFISSAYLLFRRFFN